MKRAILYGAGDLRIEDSFPEPKDLEPDEIYVTTEVTAFSTGTDLANYCGKSTEVPGAPDYPRPVGYSNAGVVQRAGSEVHQLSEGQRVFSLKPHQSAYIARGDELVVPIPRGVSPEQASLAYLTQLGLTALRQARYEPGETMAVVGLGVIGLCTVSLARAMGARVLAFTNCESREELARQLGAEAAFTDEPSVKVVHDRIDVVILTANTWSAYRTAVEIARPGGRVAILGFPGRGQPNPDFNPFHPQWFYRKSLALIAAGIAPAVECDPAEVRFNLRRNLECVLDWMASGVLRLERLISHRFPAAEMVQAYELARQHDKSLTCAIFDWRSP